MNEIEKALEWVDYIINNYGFEPRRLLVDEAHAIKSALEKQLTDRWIPVEEGLPEIEKLSGIERMYEVTVRYENFAGIFETVSTAEYIGRGEWNIYGPQPLISNKKILAWRKSEPYKEEPL